MIQLIRTIDKAGFGFLSIDWLFSGDAASVPPSGPGSKVVIFPRDEVDRDENREAVLFAFNSLSPDGQKEAVNIVRALADAARRKKLPWAAAKPNAGNVVYLGRPRGAA